MNVSVQQFNPEKLAAHAVAVFVPGDEGAFGEAAERIRSLWEPAGPVFDAKDFTGAKDTGAIVYTGNAAAARLILIGLGETAKIDVERIRRAAAAAASRLAGVKGDHLAIVVPRVDGISYEELGQALVEGAVLANYAYDKYITTNGSEGRKRLRKLSILVENDDKQQAKEMKKGAEIGKAIADAALLARDLTNAPSNELYPLELANRAKGLREIGVNVTVLDKKKIEQLGMGGLLAVNQGSTNPPAFIIMEWNGGKKGEKPIVLVGKGITFDTGGISIKPAPGMGEMKGDMGGAAAVIGAMQGIAQLGIKRNVVGLVPTTENMPDGSAYKPGDVIRFLNGKTAEIDNTDAEGRLILADALTYADRYKPAAVIDLATLTGACMIALGQHSAGLMGNNDELLERIRTAGNQSYERCTILPLYEEYKDQIKSDVADVKNTGGRPAGSITAGLFLQAFIGNYPWAHLDIAGTALVPKGYGYVPKGGTGFGARLLLDLIRNWEGDLAKEG